MISPAKITVYIEPYALDNAQIALLIQVQRVGERTIWTRKVLPVDLFTRVFDYAWEDIKLEILRHAKTEDLPGLPPSP